MGSRNQQAFIETSSGVVARRSHISAGTLTAVSGTVSTHITGGTVDALTAVVGTVNIIAILGTITSVQTLGTVQAATVDMLKAGTVDILKAGTLDMVKQGTLDMLKAGTIDKVASGTINTIDSITTLAAGTLSKLSSGTINTIDSVTTLAAGTLSKVSSGTINTIDSVTTLAAGTLNQLQAGTLDMVKAGTVSMLSAGTVTTVGMVQDGTLSMLKAGTISISASHTESGGNVLVRSTGGTSADADGVSNTLGYIHDQSGNLIRSWDYLHLFNGTTWDRKRSIVDATDSVGTGISAAGILAQLDDTSPTTITENKFGNLRMSPVRSLHVEQPFSGTHIAAAGTSTISTAAGLLHLVTINTAGATGTITLTDGTAGGGGTIAIISGNAQTTLGYNSRFTTGLSCIIAAGTAPDITISYR